MKTLKTALSLLMVLCMILSFGTARLRIAVSRQSGGE